MKAKIFIASVISLLVVTTSYSLKAAYLRNIPIKIKQPNGVEIQVFASGDEFYNWLHDANGYTIIQDPKTGYYVYAIKKNGELLPSTYYVRQDSDINLLSVLNLKIPKHLKHSWTKRKKPKELFPKGSPANIEEIHPAPHTGTINNIVIFIRFNDESEFTDPISTYDDMFNNSTSGANSMRNYFYEASYNQLVINSSFYPTPSSTTVVSYQDAHERAYYQPYNEVTNPIGYQNDDERRDREHTLLRNAVNAVSPDIPGDLNVDGDNDGYVDSVVFIVSGGPDGWNDLLWPHMWSLYSQTVYVNGKRVYSYSFHLQTTLSSSGVGVLCHEMFHTLGAPDLYHYSHDGLHPVHSWGLMGYNSNPPRHMGAYMKYRYGHWLPSIPEIITSGSYSLNPLTSSTNNCFKIDSPFSSTEYFLVEYRRKIGTFESSLPGEGILVYRINTSQDGQGNRNGPPDEVYIYRPNGTPQTDGLPAQANLCSNVGRIAINDSTNPSSFLSTGLLGGLDISNIGSLASNISFDVGLPAAGTYLLGVQSQPDTGVNINVDPTDNYGAGNGTTNFIRHYNSGTEVTLVAPASTNGKDFVKWIIDSSENYNRTINITMNDNHSVIVVYEPSVSWEGTKRLTWNAGSSSYPAIATDSSGNIHVVWEDSTPGNDEIYYKRSTDGGSSWTTKRLTWNAGSSYIPAIATDSSGNIHVVWYDYTPGNAEIYYKRSTDGGSSWQPTKRLTWNAGDSLWPSIATDPSGNIHIVWVDETPGNWEIYYKRSTDGGSSWTTKRLTWNAGYSYEPAIATDPSGNIHIVWVDETPGNVEIYYKRSTDGGSSWTTKRLTWNSGDSGLQAIATDPSGNIYVVWMDDTPGNREIYYKRSTDGGSSWQSTKRLTWNAGFSQCPAIVTDSSGNIHVVWEDTTPGNAEIYYKRSTDGGSTWTTKRLTWNAGRSIRPAIATDSSGNIHVVWNDYTPGNEEVYYKKGK